MPDAPTHLTEAEVADFLRLSPATLKRWRNKREGPPYIHVGAAVRYPHADLLIWIASRRVVPSVHSEGP